MTPKNRLNKYLGLRDLSGRWYSEEPLPKKFPEFATAFLIPMLALKGYKLAEKQRVAKHCLHRLIGTGLAGRCVIDTRDRNKGAAVMLRVAVWDAIVTAGLAIKCVGSEWSGKSTRYAATDKLLTLREVWELYLTTNLKLERNTALETPTKHALVAINSGTVDPSTGLIRPKDLRKRLEPMESTGAQTDIIKVTEDILEAFNRHNLQHLWEAVSDDGHAFYPNPCLRQFYSGGFLRLGRFYSFGDVGGQSLSKKVRRRMKIDGQRVAELDLQGSLLRLIYHKHSIDSDPKQDIYRPDLIFPKLHAVKRLSARKRRIIRDFVKRATIICLCTKRRGDANSSVGQRLAKHRERDFLQSSIYHIEKSSVKGIVGRIVKAHSEIKDDFFNDTGPWMMTREAQVMENLMMILLMADIPALLIHDAIVVRRTDLKFTRRALFKAYHGLTGFNPEYFPHLCKFSPLAWVC